MVSMLNAWYTKNGLSVEELEMIISNLRSELARQYMILENTTDDIEYTFIKKDIFSLECSLNELESVLGI